MPEGVRLCFLAKPTQVGENRESRDNRELRDSHMDSKDQRESRNKKEFKNSSIKRGGSVANHKSLNMRKVRCYGQNHGQFWNP